MDEFEMNSMENEDEIVVFEDEEGNEFRFRTEEFFFYNGEEYVLLSEIEENACEGCGGNCDECGKEEALSCIVCKVVSGTDDNGEETETFEPVQDTELAERLFEIANNKLTEDEEE